MWLVSFLALTVASQELVLPTRGEARAVSPLTTTYAGECASGPFEITFRREARVGASADIHLNAMRGGTSADLTNTPVAVDLGAEGSFVNSGFACGSENLTWYIWVVRLTSDGEPSYLRAQAVLGPNGHLISYTGLLPEASETLAPTAP